jgi:hypothetical protein
MFLSLTSEAPSLNRLETFDYPGGGGIRQASIPLPRLPRPTLNSGRLMADLATTGEEINKS